MAEMLLGAALTVAGMLLGRFMPARKEPKPPKPQPLACGCTHVLAVHEPDGDGGGTVCRAGVRGTITNWDEFGVPNGWEIGRCPCQQYTGPRMIDPGYVARELSDGSR